MGASQNQGYFFGGPYNEECAKLGSILGSPHFRKLLYLEDSRGFPRIRDIYLWQLPYAWAKAGVCLLQFSKR